VIGREHLPDVKPYRISSGKENNFYDKWLVLFCKRCNKDLDHYMPEWLPSSEPPNWVTRWYEFEKKKL
jgi:hypothetical protein